ncbi:MAG: DUF1850 domain-containing protein [Lachnospiraceae bacterium]|nr:DUF1850 domain-containing protein [Lachnospiraceae bacterium]
MLIVAYYFTKPALYVLNGDTGEVFAKYALSEDEDFSVTFIHSVNKTPVKETYEIKNNEIYLTKCTYSSLGAGVLTEVGENEKLEYDEYGNMVVSGINMKIPKLSYIVGTVSDHVLSINGEEISLRDLCGKNATAVFIYK